MDSERNVTAPDGVPGAPSAAPPPQSGQTGQTPGLLDAQTLAEARTVLDAGLATARATAKLAAVEWQLCKVGWARLLWLMPLFVVLALSIWASLLVALFSLVVALSGGAVLWAWASVIGAQGVALLLIGWQIQRTLSLSRFARTRAALSLPKGTDDDGP